MKEDNSFLWRTFKHSYEGLNTVFGAGRSYSKQLGAYSSRTDCNEEQSANKIEPQRKWKEFLRDRKDYRVSGNAKTY